MQRWDLGGLSERFVSGCSQMGTDRDSLEEAEGREGLPWRLLLNRQSGNGLELSHIVAEIHKTTYVATESLLDCPPKDDQVQH